MTTTTIHERVETEHGAVERINNCILIEWRPEIQLPAEVGQDVLTKGRVETVSGSGRPRVAFGGRTYKGRPVMIAVDETRPGLGELVEVARRMEDDAAKSRKAARRSAAANGLCPRCGSYCYGDCTASERA